MATELEPETQPTTDDSDLEEWLYTKLNELDFPKFEFLMPSGNYLGMTFERVT